MRPERGFPARLLQYKIYLKVTWQIGLRFIRKIRGSPALFLRQFQAISWKGDVAEFEVG
jgi:hypothetical protein